MTPLCREKAEWRLRTQSNLCETLTAGINAHEVLRGRGGVAIVLYTGTKIQKLPTRVRGSCCTSSEDTWGCFREPDHRSLGTILQSVRVSLPCYQKPVRSSTRTSQHSTEGVMQRCSGQSLARRLGTVAPHCYQHGAALVLHCSIGLHIPAQVVVGRFWNIVSIHMLEARCKGGKRHGAGTCHLRNTIPCCSGTRNRGIQSTAR